MAELTTANVDRGPHRICAYEQAGEGPAIVLMHGFPDNHHLYDRLTSHLPGRHLVTFDFLGWGESDKPGDYKYTFEGQAGDLNAVVTGLGLERVALVPHDASGPAAINWALDHAEQVSAIVALNTFYSLTAGVPPGTPEAIRLFSDPNLARLAAHFAESPGQFRWLYEWQVGGFILDDEVRREYVPLLFRQFETQPSSIGPFMQLNADLMAAVLANTGRTEEIGAFQAPIRFAFGEEDRDLTPAHGAALSALFPHAKVSPIPGAGHFPQLDAPAKVANTILDTLAALGF